MTTVAENAEFRNTPHRPTQSCTSPVQCTHDSLRRAIIHLLRSRERRLAEQAAKAQHQQGAEVARDE